MFTLKVCLVLVPLILCVKTLFAFELERFTIMENSHYQPYEKLFKKRPNLQFNNTYTNQFLLNADTEINRSKTKKLRVCFKSPITINDRLLNNYDVQFKDSRKITEYILAKISKYTSLKFFLTSDKCHIKVNFKRSLDKGVLGETNFYIVDSQPRANIEIDSNQIQTFVKDLNLNLLKVFMQVLMHEMLHALGLDHNVDDPDARSIIRQAYDFTSQQLLYKKDVYNLRAIYGPRHDYKPNINNLMDATYFADPSDWSKYDTDDVQTTPVSRNRPNSQATSVNRNRPNSQNTSSNRNRSTSRSRPTTPTNGHRPQTSRTSPHRNRPQSSSNRNRPTTPMNRNRPNGPATPSSNRNRPQSSRTSPNRNRPNGPTTLSSNRNRPRTSTLSNRNQPTIPVNSYEDPDDCIRNPCAANLQKEFQKLKYSGLEKKRG